MKKENEINIYELNTRKEKIKNEEEKNMNYSNDINDISGEKKN